MEEQRVLLDTFVANMKQSAARCREDRIQAENYAETLYRSLGPRIIRWLMAGSPRRSRHALEGPSRRRSRRSSPRRCGYARR